MALECYQYVTTQIMPWLLPGAYRQFELRAPVVLLYLTSLVAPARAQQWPIQVTCRHALVISIAPIEWATSRVLNVIRVR